MRFVPTLLLIAALAACRDVTPPAARVVPVMQVIAGDRQIDTIGRELPNAIRVQILDSITRTIPQPGILVNWVVTQGAGHVFAGSAISNQNGEVQERWTLGMIPGDQILEARAVDAATGAPLTFSVAHATGLPRPTVLLTNNDADSVRLTLQWTTGQIEVVAAPAFTVRCIFLAFVGDTLNLQLHRNSSGSDYPLGPLPQNRAMGMTVTVAAAQSGAWNWSTSPTPCSPV